MHQIPGDRMTKISAIKIMSQYNAQCSAIRNALAEKTYTDVNVDTVVACQGTCSIEHKSSASPLCYFFFKVNIVL